VDLCSLVKSDDKFKSYIQCSFGDKYAYCEANSELIIIFWEMTPCGSYKNSKLLYRRRLESPPIQELTISLCTCSHLFTLKMEAIRSSETSVLIRATRRHLPEDDNHHSHRRGNLKSNIIFVYFFITKNYYNNGFVNIRSYTDIGGTQ
jgi:hypothetical protein